MEIICVINNYNYSRYLEECIDSVLSQTLPFNKVIVVDDGSTDNSPEIIRRYQALNSKVIPILKTNSGQLSCFNAAAEYIPEDSQVFLLDSDDFFPKDYLEVLSRKVSFPADFCFVTAVDFFQHGDQLQNANISNDENVIFPKTSELVRARAVWIGSVTSAISMSGKIYKKLLPYPHPEDWKSRADDVFVYISSVLGAVKVKVPSVGIGYRKHQNNDHIIKSNFYNSHEEQLERQERLKRLFDFYCEKYNIPRQASFAEILPEYNACGTDGIAHLKSLGFRLF